MLACLLPTQDFTPGANPPSDTTRYEKFIPIYPAKNEKKKIKVKRLRLGYFACWSHYSKYVPYSPTYVAPVHRMLIRYRIPYSTRTQRYKGSESTCKIKWIKWARFNTIIY